MSLKGEAIRGAEGRILAGKMDAYNDFGKEAVAVKAFTDFEVKDGNLVIRMPACAVAEIRL